MGKAADPVEQAVHETLPYYGFPDIHWQKIRTNNPLERIMKTLISSPQWMRSSGRGILGGEGRRPRSATPQRETMPNSR
jgi:hypothetical protein